MVKNNISVTVDGNKTLEQFQQLIRERSKYLKETSEQSVSACALDVLRSIRALTTKATKASVKKEVVVEPYDSVYISAKTVGGKKMLCLRNTGSKTEYVGKEKVIYPTVRQPLKNFKVFKFNDTYSNRTYLIVSPSSALAKKTAISIKQKEALRYSGLARNAISMLMKKAFNKNSNDDVEGHITQVSNSLTSIQRRKSGDSFSITLNDNLDYALPAVKGGQSGIDLAFQKAMNKITATINHKCKDLLMFKKLDTPFPELKKG